MCQVGLLVSWLLFVGGGLFDLHVSIFPGVLLLTFAVRCGTMRCLLRTVEFG